MSNMTTEATSDIADAAIQEFTAIANLIFDGVKQKIIDSGLPEEQIKVFEDGRPLFVSMLTDATSQGFQLGLKAAGSIVNKTSKDKKEETTT